MKKILLVVTLVATMTMARLSAAEDHQMMHAADTATGSEAEYKAAHHSMMSSIDITYTGDADVDFVTGMIPHHQGAVDMAKVELKYGTDPEIRKLAKDIIAAQEKEIAFMKAWLEKHAKQK